MVSGWALELGLELELDVELDVELDGREYVL
jgi:hypothetical protein